MGSPLSRPPATPAALARWRCPDYWATVDASGLDPVGDAQRRKTERYLAAAPGIPKPHRLEPVARFFSSPPSDPRKGDFYFNAGYSVMYGYDGTRWLPVVFPATRVL